MLGYTAADVDALGVSDFLHLCDGLAELKRQEDEAVAKIKGAMS